MDRALSKTAKRTLVLCALLLAALGILAGQGCAITTRANSYDGVGKTLYVRHCQQCHGEAGDRIPMAPLNSPDFLDQRKDVGLLLSVREGKGIMPAWSEARGGPLYDTQIFAVVGYVNTLARRDTPLTMAARGKEVYLKGCRDCHGEAGDRVPVARLSSEEFWAARMDTALVAASIERGGREGMPAQGRSEGGSLSREDIDAVVAFLRARVVQQQAVLAGRGRDVYDRFCQSCHGRTGDALPNASLRSPSFLASRGDDLLRLVVSQGTAGSPAFGSFKGGPLSSEEVEAVLLYLKVWAGIPAKLTSGGVGVAAESKSLYLTSCAPCHGEKGDKLATAPLMDSQFLVQRGEAALIAAVSRGNDRGMPPWSKEMGGSLTEDQIRSVVRFLVSTAMAFNPSPPAPAATGPVTPPARGSSSGPAQPSGLPGASTPPLPQQTDNNTSAGDAAAGERLFAQNCAACHGQTRDKMPTAKLADRAWLQERGDAALANSIANGKGAMPAWGKSKGGALADDEIASILAYLKKAVSGGPSGGEGQTAPGTVSGPPDAAPQPAPKAPRRTEPVVITAETGRELFMKNCTLCHGEDGMRQPTAPLGMRQWVSGKGFDGLVMRISSGRPSAGMPAWGEENGGPLAEEEIKAIAEYVLRAARD